ncbi:hypothetical protein [Spiroplasma endosymbiont of Panorpa germanica]|uniref:hypothetical protein n=1 Tax=Spiroplasma endosymbiont of Panorpa germanica TaxID=3066314 RepID=UPI0030D605E6
MSDMYWIVLGIGIAAILFGATGLIFIVRNSKKNNTKNNQKNSQDNQGYHTELQDIKKITKDFFKNAKKDVILDYFGNKITISLSPPKDLLKELKITLKESQIQKAESQIQELWTKGFEDIKTTTMAMEKLFLDKFKSLEEEVEVGIIITKGYVSILNEILDIFANTFWVQIMSMQMAIISKDESLMAPVDEPINSTSLNKKIKKFKATLKELVKYIEADIK